jgi:Ca2+-binding EF-hand superfamily protein
VEKNSAWQLLSLDDLFTFVDENNDGLLTLQQFKTACQLINKVINVPVR